MQISGRFTTAMHLLCYVAMYSEEECVTSDAAAQSAGVNPVVIRNLMRQLSRASLITVDRYDGIMLKKKPAKITLYDVYLAVESVDRNTGLFRFHGNPDLSCPVGGGIHAALDKRLLAAQKAMEKELKSQTLEDVMKDLRKSIRKAEKKAGKN